MDIGVDKILLTTDHFKVSDRCSFRIKQGDIVDGEIVESLLFYDNKGDVKGTKAIYNSLLANVTIDPRGLKLEYNPSKLLHPYHLNNDNQSLKEITNAIRADLKDKGILLGMDAELSVSRLDLARNEQMSRPIGFYAPLFSSLKGKRQSNKEYPNSYYFYNKSQEANFYDKEKALDYEYKGRNVPEIEKQTMRGELRAKKRDSVGRIYRFNDFATLLKSSPEYRIERYKGHLKSQLFSTNNPLQTTMFPDYQRNIEYLKALKEKLSRGAVQQYIQSKGIDTLLSEVGTLENFRMMLLEAGYERKYSYKIITSLKDQLHQVAMFYGDTKEENISSLYNEVFEKFVG